MLTCWLALLLICKKIHRITEILPFDLNHDFSQFPNFIKIQQLACDGLRQNENQCLIIIRHVHHFQK